MGQLRGQKWDKIWFSYLCNSKNIAVLLFCISPAKWLIIRRFKVRKLQVGVFTHQKSPHLDVDEGKLLRLKQHAVYSQKNF